jgi:CDGSH-type Zn-finger protein
MTEAVVAQEFPYEVELEEGKNYAWCSCGLSQKQPFCDGAHKAGELRPTVFKAEASEKVWMCGCKQTKEGPKCDGSHKTL